MVARSSTLTGIPHRHGLGHALRQRRLAAAGLTCDPDGPACARAPGRGRRAGPSSRASTTMRAEASATLPFEVSITSSGRTKKR